MEKEMEETVTGEKDGATDEEEDGEAETIPAIYNIMYHKL